MPLGPASKPSKPNRRVPPTRLLDHDDTRLRHAAAKLTHVGEQTAPVHTIVIQAFTHLPRLEGFRPFHAPGLSYANDDLPVILNFSVTPEVLRRLLERAVAVMQSAQGVGAAAASFVAVVDLPEAIEGVEARLGPDGEAKLLGDLADALAPDDHLGRRILGAGMPPGIGGRDPGR
jgi:hypothetical protein